MPTSPLEDNKQYPFGAFYRDAHGYIWRKIHNDGFDWLDTASGRTTNPWGPSQPVTMVLDAKGEPPLKTLVTWYVATAAAKIMQRLTDFRDQPGFLRRTEIRMHRLTRRYKNG